MPPVNKATLYVKRAVLIVIILAIVIIGYLLGSFLSSRYRGSTFKATFVSIAPVSYRSSAI